MKYLIYLRVSTEKQDEEQQLDHCLRFIKQFDKKDFSYEVFRDKITSKKAFFITDKKGNITGTRREGVKLLMEKVKKGDIIIALRLDRIVRSLYETTLLIKMLDELDVEILLVDQPGIKNKIMLGLYAGMAEEEIKLLRKRVKEKLENKKSIGHRYSRFLPYGYGLHETKLVPIRDGDEIVMKRGILIPIHEEQMVLSRMYQFAEQGMNHSQIAKALTNQGYRNREGNPFQKMSIYRILSRKEKTMSSDQLPAVKEDLLCSA